MSDLNISLIAFACMIGGTLLGMVVRFFLPDHHVSDESRDAVKLGVGTIATIAALVLSLLIASAKGTFDTMSGTIRQVAGRAILLDRCLAHYGPETQEARDSLRRGVASSIQRIWPEEKKAAAMGRDPEGWVDIELVQTELRRLAPKTDAQRWLQSRALQVTSEIAEARWLLIAQIGQRSIPMPFLVVLVGWLTVIFFSFGLLSPCISTVFLILLICAFSSAGALFLILELDAPYEGLLKVSSTPLHNALAHLGQ